MRHAIRWGPWVIALAVSILPQIRRHALHSHQQGAPLAQFVFSLLIASLARQWLSGLLARPPQPITGGRLAVIIPVRNEAATVAEVVRGVPKQQLKRLGWNLAVIVVDDGSNDASGGLAEQAGAEIVVHHDFPRGLGAALRTGMQTAREQGAQAAVYLDGDGEYDPGHMARLLGPIAHGKADYVLGSRFRGSRKGMSRERTLGNLGFTALLVLLTGRPITDAQTGYRAFSGRALDCAEIIHDYNYAQVLTLDLLRKGMRMSEVPIDYVARTTGRSFIRGPEYLRRVLPAIAWQLVRP